MSIPRSADLRRHEGRRHLRLVFTSGRDAARGSLLQRRLALPADPMRQAGVTSGLERSVHRRAVEVVLWGMPAVNYDLLRRTIARKTTGGFNQVAYWSQPPDWKIHTLTPNPDAIYFTPVTNTAKVGPVVLEIPPADVSAITGTVMNVWQCALEDVGPSGVDKGRGGKYLILPPGYKETVPAGYIPLPSDTYEGYALLCSIPTSGREVDVARAAALGKRIRIYPLARTATPPSTTFVDVLDVEPNSTISGDVRFFESLNRIVQTEPWLERDRAMIDQLRTIGIEKGRPFKPGPRMKALLEDAAREADDWLAARDEASLSSPYYQGGHWAFPGSRDPLQGQATCFAKPDIYPVDFRGVTFSHGYFAPKHAGVGSSSLLASVDKEGRLLAGASTYRLAVPANVPARQCWAVVVQDVVTHAPISDARWPGRTSQTPGLQQNADGTVDLYFGPRPPAGRESNWVPTSPAGVFEVLFRLYGPEKPLFEKTWRLPDLEKVHPTCTPG